MRKDKEGFLYDPIPDELMLQNINLFKELLSSFQVSLSEQYGKIKYYSNLVYEIYERIDQRKDYYLFFHSGQDHRMEMSQVKETALFAYWLIKYKPLYLQVKETNDLMCHKNCTINEYFAIYCILSFVKGIKEYKDIQKLATPENIDNLVYNFMHRDISKEAMICLVSSLFNDIEK